VYTFDLFVMNVDGSGVTALTTGASNDAEPSWSR
jgi:Tol biopolymer transport system component